MLQIRLQHRSCPLSSTEQSCCRKLSIKSLSLLIASRMKTSTSLRLVQSLIQIPNFLVSRNHCNVKWKSLMSWVKGKQILLSVCTHRELLSCFCCLEPRVAEVLCSKSEKIKRSIACFPLRCRWISCCWGNGFI